MVVFGTAYVTVLTQEPYATERLDIILQRIERLDCKFTHISKGHPIGEAEAICADIPWIPIWDRGE